MLRYICTVFVALAICQAAFAVNLELANQPSPTIDLFYGQRAPARFLGDMTAGQRRAGETVYTYEHRSENNGNEVSTMQHVLQVPKGKIIHYVNAVTKDGATAVICETQTTLGSFSGFIDIRQPPKSQSRIVITIGAH